MTQPLSNSDHCNKEVMKIVIDEQNYKSILSERATYYVDRKFWNRVAMRSMPCLTLRMLRERLPAVLTVSFLTSKSSALFNVPWVFVAALRQLT